MALRHALEDIAGVLEQVPPVGHLHRVRGPQAQPLGVDAAAVARRHLGAGVPAQPPRQARRRPLGQEVHDLVALQVDQHRAVAVAPLPGPLVDPQHPRRRAGGGHHLAQHAEQGVGADRQPQAVRQPGARLAAEGRGHLEQQGGGGRRPPGGAGQGRPEGLRERPPRAGGGGAAEPTHGQGHAGRGGPPGDVQRPAGVAVVHLSGDGAAGGARAGVGHPLSVEPDDTSVEAGLADHEGRRRAREQHPPGMPPRDRRVQGGSPGVP